MKLILQTESAKRFRTSVTCTGSGPTYMEDLNEAGGVYAVMNELNKKDLYTDRTTVTERQLEKISQDAKINPEVIRPIDNPYAMTGGLAVLKGNIAPDGSVVKTFCSCTGNAGT